MAAVSASATVAHRLAAPAAVDGLRPARANLSAASKRLLGSCSLGSAGRRPRSCASKFMSLRRIGSYDGPPLPSSFSSARDRRPPARREPQKAPQRESQLQHAQNAEMETETKPEAEAPPQSTTLEVRSSQYSQSSCLSVMRLQLPGGNPRSCGMFEPVEKSQGHGGDVSFPPEPTPGPDCVTLVATRRL